MAPNLGIVSSLLGGLLPAVIWLVFWWREDRDHPEPKPLLVAVFLVGAAAVVPAYFLQEWLRLFWQLNAETRPIATVMAWAGSEEIIKYLVVALVAFSSRFFDEPIDAMIYLITAALGFAAAENSLFLANVLSAGGNPTNFWLNGGFRFIGATIVHVVSSGLVGVSVALGFCQARGRQIWWLFWGLLTATLLHGLFNYLIINSAGENILKIFILFWALAVILIALFERVKVLVCRPTKS